MNDTLIILAGFVGTAASMAGLYVFTEISTVYWMPGRADRRWKSLVELPKLLYFRAAFRLLMPLCAAFSAVQMLLSIKLILDGFERI